MFTLNLGWRHKFSDRLSATLTAQDVLDTNRFRRVLETSTLRDNFYGKPVSRAVMIRLDYRFGGTGGRPAREPGFDYDAGAGAGAAQ
jgi:hypothetical protein